MTVSSRLRILAVALVLLTARHNANGSQKPSTGSEKPVVYNHVSKGSESMDDVKARKLYERSFKIVDFSDERGYVRSKVTRKVIPRPVIENGHSVKGDARLIFVVNQQGRAVMPFVVRSTNTKLNKTVLDIITQWRGTAARLNGAPIAVLLHQDFTFK
jgi:hypothetical protein